MRLCAHRVLLLLLVCAVTLGPSSVRAEPAPADGDPEAAAPTTGDTEDGAEARRPRRAREVPESMVLCRGPRGAVYARDVKAGCRSAQLNPGNLVDFGAGDDCFLRRATVFDPGGEKTKAAKTCDDICRAADEARACVVALKRGSQDWATFGPTESFSAGSEELLDATAVCCRR